MDSPGGSGSLVCPALAGSRYSGCVVAGGIARAARLALPQLVVPGE